MVSHGDKAMVAEKVPANSWLTVSSLVIVTVGGDPDVDVVVVIARVLPGGGENRVAIK